MSSTGSPRWQFCVSGTSYSSAPLYGRRLHAATSLSPSLPSPALSPHVPRGRLVGSGSFVQALILTCAQPHKAATPLCSQIRNVPCPIDCRARCSSQLPAASPARARLLWQAHPSFRDGAEGTRLGGWMPGIGYLGWRGRESWRAARKGEVGVVRELVTGTELSSSSSQSLPCWSPGARGI